MARPRREDYLPSMRLLSKTVVVVIATVLAASASDNADAARKKPRVKRDTGVIVTRDYDGTPIIMRGLPPRPRLGEPPNAVSDREPGQRVERPRVGSSTYIPPPVPAPTAANSPPPAVMLQPPPQPYTPPQLDSFGDRVTRCLHSYPLNAGAGNNPTERGAYVRQCAN